MSDLKHQDIPELRRRLRSVIKYREDKTRQLERLEKEIKVLQDEISETKRQRNNVGQKEVWIRYYLAQKEIEEEPKFHA